MYEKLSFVINVSSFTSGSVFCCLWNLFLFRETFFSSVFFIHSTMLFWIQQKMSSWNNAEWSELLLSYLMAIFLIFYTIFSSIYRVKLLPHCRSLSWFRMKMVLKFLKCHLILNFFMLLCTFHGIKMKKKWSALLGIRNKKKVKSCLLLILCIWSR